MHPSCQITSTFGALVNVAVPTEHLRMAAVSSLEAPAACNIAAYSFIHHLWCPLTFARDACRVGGEPRGPRRALRDQNYALRKLVPFPTTWLQSLPPEERYCRGLGDPHTLDGAHV